MVFAHLCVQRSEHGVARTLESEITAGLYSLEKLRIGTGDEAAFSRAENLGGVQADDEWQAARRSRVERGGGVDDHRNAGAVFEQLPGSDVDGRTEGGDDDKGAYRARHSLQSLSHVV